MAPEIHLGHHFEFWGSNGYFRGPGRYFLTTNQNFGVRVACDKSIFLDKDLEFGAKPIVWYQNFEFCDVIDILEPKFQILRSKSAFLN